MRSTAARLAAAVGAVTLAVALLPATATASTVVYETYSVPTVDGKTIRVEVVRDTAVDDAPVILTSTPYTILSDAVSGLRPADDAYASRYVPRGYARAVADVLGTRGSSGCWDYGGADEQQSAVDVVRFLAGQDWSNGKVGMIGGSYEGTTATMVAARGDDVPELAAIVPIVGISRWYGYSWSDGVRYFGNSERPTDEGFDTPLAFDFGFGRVPPVDFTDPNAGDAVIDRTGECDSLEHTERGYDNPDYDDFWLERDYRKDAANFRAAALIAHGWQDYNVKQEEGVKLFEALPVDDPTTEEVEGVPFKLLHVYQRAHQSPADEHWQPLLDAFLDHTLKGVDNGVDRREPVLTEGRAADEISTGFRSEASWPPAGTRDVTLFLRRGLAGGSLATRPGTDGPASYRDLAIAAEERSRQLPAAETDWLYYASPPLAGDVRLAGDAVLDVVASVDRDHAYLTPVLVDIAPDGTLRTVSRGFADLAYRNGLESREPLPVGEPFRAQVTFKPQDQTFRAGHRIGVLVQSSNVVWAVPDTPGAEVTLWHGTQPMRGKTSSRLVLPLDAPPVSQLFTP